MRTKARTLGKASRNIFLILKEHKILILMEEYRDEMRYVTYTWLSRIDHLKETQVMFLRMKLCVFVI